MGQEQGIEAISPSSQLIHAEQPGSSFKPFGNTRRLTKRAKEEDRPDWLTGLVRTVLAYPESRVKGDCAPSFIVAVSQVLGTQPGNAEPKRVGSWQEILLQ